MQNGDWNLGYFAFGQYNGAALTFGQVKSGIYCLSEPDTTFADGEYGDAVLPGEDGVRFGRDYQRNGTVTFELGVDTVDAPVDRHFPPAWTKAGVLIGDWPDDPAILKKLKATGNPWSWNEDGLNMLRQVWRADAVRFGSTSRLGWLSHMVAGHSRRLYGRPRKFSVSHSRLTRQGYTPVVATFDAVDDRFYDDVAKYAEMWDRVPGTVPPRPGRPAPPAAPSKKSAAVSSAGRTPSWAVITITGPCLNPKVTLGSWWTVELSTLIADGESVVIDARPWERTALLVKANGSKVSVADKLTRASPRLAELIVPPGNWTATMAHTKLPALPGTGPTVEVSWRDAFTWW
ncbi:hypothetical protein ACIP9H_33655 [Streptomyces sp. NPDC088732]|uniref:hypothetical protein n=1 Tax=Streptomyces sp. NPDC088732 TaxID=3365879 RepID=UPI0037FD3B7C